jgi:hypothetical protein
LVRVALGSAAEQVIAQQAPAAAKQKQHNKRKQHDKHVPEKVTAFAVWLRYVVFVRIGRMCQCYSSYQRPAQSYRAAPALYKLYPLKKSGAKT